MPAHTPMHNQLAVFVKHWPHLTLPELGRHVKSIGFDSIELPIRPGFPCQPETVEKDLPEASKVLANEGVEILNVTADNALDDERLYAACAEAGVTLNRIMFRRGDGNYWDEEEATLKQLEQAQPLCEQYNVRIGVQNHAGRFVPGNAFGLYSLLKNCDTRYVGAVWDAAHEALEGIDPKPALDIVEDFLLIVNLKNGFWRRTNGPEAEDAKWESYWTSSRQGRTDWPRVVAKLREMAYTGPICLTAEYSDSTALDRLIAEDLAFARTLLDVST